MLGAWLKTGLIRGSGFEEEETEVESDTMRHLVLHDGSSRVKGGVSL